MSRTIIGPFNRVEGDLEVHLEIEGQRVQSARVNATLYRGFEQILVGRPAADALVIAPRICGICSVAQSAAASGALAQLAGITAPPNGRLAAQLIQATENIADHLSHFYLFFMPDFARPSYGAAPWHPAAAARFRGLTQASRGESGSASAEIMPARARLLHILGLLAGKWPHSLALQPGGTTKAPDEAERIRLIGLIAEFRRFLERVLFAAPLERIAGLASLTDLETYEAEEEAGDFRHFLRLARALDLGALGAGPERYLSFGGLGLPAGVWREGIVQPLDLDAITEDVTSAHMAAGHGPLHPSQGLTRPEEKAAAYSWCKAPRLGGQSIEVGALARQLIAGQSLIRDLQAKGGYAGLGGSSVLARVTARLVEIASLTLAMETWARALAPRQPFFLADGPSQPLNGSGVGLVEAARGGLGHWLRVEGGQIAAYQIIAPTTWNFSPRDAQGQPGPVEQALIGCPAPEGEESPLAAQHIIRSFDPCMACTVH